MTPSGTHIAIVGAGIGGLAVAHALDRCGFRVSLFEQAETLSEIGSGISIWENGLQALEVIGLREAVEACGQSWSAYEIHRPGKPVVTRSNQILSLDGTVSPIIIKRGVLFGVLRDNLSPAVEIKTSFKLKTINDHTLIAEDGREITADIIIGADGAHSCVRQHLTSDVPRFCKQICFRGVTAWPVDEPLTPAEVYDKDHHRFGYFLLPNNEVYWFDIVDSANTFEPFAKFQDDVRSLSRVIASLVENTPADSILCHPIEEMAPVTHIHNHIALIGDAAHPFQPSLGQGACLALEDAVVLAACLNARPDNYPKAIQTYVSKRKKRWKSYYKMCQQLGTGALDKGLRGRQRAIARMVHTPEWSLSLFGKRIFAFKQRETRL